MRRNVIADHGFQDLAGGKDGGVLHAKLDVGGHFVLLFLKLSNWHVVLSVCSLNSGSDCTMGVDGATGSVLSLNECPYFVVGMRRV